MRRKIREDLFEKLRHLNLRREASLAPVSTGSEEGIRRQAEEEDIRPSFSRDTDRIIHSRSYTRYIDKTQVFYFVENDHITHRVLHVQLVSKIARQIGRSLGLNEDLIEAIALGHDIGHAPFGHTGEKLLSKICEENGIGKFCHNVQSVISLDHIERWNLTLQVLDGILCHNGETHEQVLKPDRGKTWNDHDREIQSMIKGDPGNYPMTLEGCVVRISDTISYIGRDLEDAIMVGLIERDEVPERCAEVIGNENRDIVNTLIIDVIENSWECDYISLSKEVAEALDEFKRFNYEKIYENPVVNREVDKIEKMFRLMFGEFLHDLEADKRDSRIFQHHIDLIKDKNPSYADETSNAEIVRDFIAGMTDKYFSDTMMELYFPKRYKYSVTQKDFYSDRLIN
ncbi:MAG: metal-dependent phosphohydrolase HD sub domain protein [Candidatus Syntrophoarchaeum caldarius]|uniref:Metal-dependent phosphohydrolase HD sub domain protein n=1 Tax=Candidatus Syntropharchaeum caldarium TaxID=1838285 RepID=A0A1F2PCG3_9EURY|nr:MAG: metal-dependent phosphohydrolase HD sub domain protein [Candidatus Syntrophoarchaeum caldarius]